MSAALSARHSGILMPFFGADEAERRICLGGTYVPRHLSVGAFVVAAAAAAAASRYYVIMAIIVTRLWRHLWHFWPDDSLACLQLQLLPPPLTIRSTVCMFVCGTDFYPRFPQIRERQAGNSHSPPPPPSLTALQLQTF